MGPFDPFDALNPSISPNPFDPTGVLSNVGDQQIRGQAFRHQLHRLGLQGLSLNALASLINPPGAITAYAGADAPTGWLLCYGQAVSRLTYSALFEAIGTTYGIGDGYSTFNVPDLRGRVIAGQDDMGGTSANRLTGVTGSVNGDTLGGTGGAETHTLSTAEMPAHTHTQDAHTHTQNSHNHTQDAHNHTQDAHTHTQNSHNHTQDAHNHTITDPGHTHGLPEGQTDGDGTLVDKSNAADNNPAVVTDSAVTGVTVDNATAINQAATATNQNATATNQAATATNQAATATNQNATATNQNTGGGGAHNNVQPTIILNYLIKT